MAVAWGVKTKPAKQTPQKPAKPTAHPKAVATVKPKTITHAKPKAGGVSGTGHSQAAVQQIGAGLFVKGAGGRLQLVGRAPAQTGLASGRGSGGTGFYSAPAPSPRAVGGGSAMGGRGSGGSGFNGALQQAPAPHFMIGGGGHGFGGGTAPSYDEAYTSTPGGIGPDSWGGTPGDFGPDIPAIMGFTGSPGGYSTELANNFSGSGVNTWGQLGYGDFSYGSTVGVMGGTGTGDPYGTGSPDNSGQGGSSFGGGPGAY